MKTMQYTYNFEPEMYKYILSTNILNKKKHEDKIFKSLVLGYGAKEDSMKSLKYMLEATVDFFKMLNSEAESQEEKQLIRQYAQQLTQM